MMKKEVMAVLIVPISCQLPHTLEQHHHIGHPVAARNWNKCYSEWTCTHMCIIIEFLQVFVLLSEGGNLIGVLYFTELPVILSTITNTALVHIHSCTCSRNHIITHMLTHTHVHTNPI